MKKIYLNKKEFRYNKIIDKLFWVAVFAILYGCLLLILN